MAQEFDVPVESIRQIAREIAAEEVKKFARSGFLQNASISGGAGLRIKDGGSLRLESADGVEIVYVGPVSPPLADGSPQPGLIVRRNDGTIALHLYDPIPDPGDYNQFLAWRDRAGHVVFSDDTDSGQGHARPWLSGGFGRARYADMSVSTTSSTFETLWETRVSKQQPKMLVSYKATMDTTGTTGETQVLVNDQPLGPIASEAFALATRSVGPVPVAGSYSADLIVKIQGRRTSATGALRVEALGWETRQS